MSGKPTNFQYTWKPDSVDSRDYILTATSAKLPAFVDLRSAMPDIEDQGYLGSCTGNAIVGALEYLDKKNDNVYEDISRLFVYYQERLMEGTVNQDSGAQIRDGIKACAKIGACTEKLWPYDYSKFTVKPSDEAYADAAKRKITQYLRITNINALKQSLADGYPVVFGFRVYKYFETEEMSKTGILKMPSWYESPLGGHAVLCVGYDDVSSRIIVRNSWGKGWGQEGYFTMPYKYVTKSNLSSDYWSIRK